MNQDELNNFHNPPVEFRIIPFWFWNGEMDENIIIHQIREMAEKGVGGFFICARQGLAIPYLSQQWFDRVKFAVEVARQQGLQVWLYDEYPYPSGMSGGEVILQHPDARQYNLLHYTQKVEAGQRLEQELPWARLLFAKAVPLDRQTGALNWPEEVDLTNHTGNFQAQTVFQKTGLTMYNDKRYFTYEPRKKLVWQVPGGDWQLVIFQEQEIEDFKYFGTYLDPCNAEAVQTFIDTTYERYAANFKEEFGKTIKGMFSDEVGIYGNPPWSPKLLAAFEKRHNYSLKDKLMTLQYYVGEATPKIRYDYFQTLHLLLRETYHQKISEWCDAHGIKYITEVPSVRMTTQLYSHITGGDSAHEKLGRSLEWIFNRNILNFRANPKMVSSLSRQLGLGRAFIECFHSVGWSMTLQDAKWMLDRLAAMGINFFNFHAFFYTLNGLRKHDAPPSQFLQNPYWQHFKKLGDYAGRMSYLLSQGKPALSIAVLDPTTSLWTHLGNPFHEFKYCGSDPLEEARLEKLKEDWAYICKTLLLHQVEYDHLDPEILIQSEIEDSGLIMIGNAAYSALILPPLVNLEAKAWAKIKTFLAAGGTVVSLGLLPYEVIEQGQAIEEDVLHWFGLDANSSPRRTYWQSQVSLTGQVQAPSTQFSWTRGTQSAYFLAVPGGMARSEAGPELLSFLMERVLPPVIIDISDASRKSLLMQVRDWPDGSKIVFIANQESPEIELKLVVEASAFNFGGVEELDLESGDTRPLEAELDGSTWRIRLHFAPYQSRLVHITGRDLPGTSQPVSDKAGNPHGKEFPLPPPVLNLTTRRDWAVAALQPNIIRLANFHLALDPANKGIELDWPLGQAGEKWPLVEVKTLIDQCADLARVGSPELPLQFDQIFGTPVKLHLTYPLTCWYQTSFEIEILPPDCKLMLDTQAIEGVYRVYLNGNELNPANFGPFNVYDHSNQVCNIQPFLLEGRNTLVVRVEANHDWSGLTDPLYLVGNFGVYFSPARQPIIGSPTETVELRSGLLTGFPYFAGTLALTSTFELENIPQAPEFEINFTEWDADLHDCLEVLVNGQSLGVRAWSPYTWQGSRSLLLNGQNQLEVRLTNTLSGLLEGKYFDYSAHGLVSY